MNRFALIFDLDSVIAVTTIHPANELPKDLFIIRDFTQISTVNIHHLFISHP
jgi:hypothetical protein